MVTDSLDQRQEAPDGRSGGDLLGFGPIPPTIEAVPTRGNASDLSGVNPTAPPRPGGESSYVCLVVGVVEGGEMREGECQTRSGASQTRMPGPPLFSKIIQLH